MAAAVACAAVVWLGGAVSAHKPITSPYTFYEDVLPITQARCGACHAPDGIAPMSLLSHDAAVPWAESMRLELVAGHMPPGPAPAPAGRFHQPERLSARELNVLLTWATGGTPAGDPAKASSSASTPPAWTLGPPSDVIRLPHVELAAGTAARVVESVVPLGPRSRTVAAVDVQPGTPALVRSARVLIRERAAGSQTERVVALWVPGARASRLSARAGWRVAPGAELVVRTVYRKRWDREREAASDDSAVAIYEQEGASGPDVGTIEVQADETDSRERRLVASTVLEQPATLVALWPDIALAGASVRVDVVSSVGARSTLATFDAQAGWERRFHLVEPEPLGAGTRIEVTAAWASAGHMPPPGLRLLGLDVIPSE